MSLRRALKNEKVPAETVYIAKKCVPVVNDAREEREFWRVQADRRFTKHEKMARGYIKSSRGEVD